MLNPKRLTGIFISLIVLSALFLAGCQQPTEPTIPQSTSLVAPSRTVAPTPVPPTSAPTSPDEPMLIIQSSIRETVQVIFFNEKLQPIKSFAGSLAHPFLSPDQCELNSLSYIDNQISIEAFDYEGKMIDSKIITLAETGTHFVHALTMSPDGNWIAYKETSGDYGRSYADGEIQDVNIVRVISSEPQTPIRVSVRSGAKWSNLSWSPDREGFLYTDFDQNTRHQVFLFNPETGSRTQVTHLEMDYMISDLEWSTDSEYFAYSFYDIQSDETETSQSYGRIGLVRVADLSTFTITPDIADSDTIQIIWGNGNRMLILAGRQATHSSVLSWYDLESQRVIESVESSTFDPDGWIYYAFPLNDDLTSIGLLGRSVYIYDSPSGSYTTIDDKEIVDWFLLGELRVLRNTAGSYRPINCGLE